MAERLPAHLEAMAIIRQVQAQGGFAALLRKGDPDRGALTLLLRQRGEFYGLLERAMGSDFEYRWTLVELELTDSSESFSQFAAEKERFDRDFWLIELDVADAERFVAETIASA